MSFITPVAAAIQYLALGAGAVPRSITNKLRETISVDDYGALGNNVADDWAAIVTAQTVLAALGGGDLLFTFGKTYRITTASIPQVPGISYRGTGRSAVDNAPGARGARIVSAVVDIFSNAATLTAGLSFHDLWIESEVGGGHLFNWSSAGIVAKVEIAGCTLVQGNTAKSVIKGTSAGGVFSIWMHDFEFRYMVANTVPAITFSSPTVNSITIERFWSLCTLGATSGTYAIWVESTNAGGAAFNVLVRQGVFEVPGGGAVNFLSCAQSKMEDLGVYDLLVAPASAVFRCAKGATGPVSSGCKFERLRSTVGTAGAPDLQVDVSVGGASAHVIENCALTWLDQVSANGASVTHIANSIANYENCAFTELGGSATLDLRFVSQAAGAHTWAFWNGLPGNNNGAWNINRDGAYAGAYSAAGLLQWGGTFAAPAFYLSQAGLLNTKNKIYPGTPGLVDQAVCGIFAGNGAPSNADGANGDFYFRGDGGAGSRVYIKAAGAWSGIV